MTGDRDPLDLAAAYAPLAVTSRSGVDESVHHGALVAVDAHGEVVVSVGDPHVAIYPRSSTKPIQATAMVRLGLDLPADLLALVCASHDGHARHIAGSRAILARAGLDESALLNTPDLPLDPVEARAVLRAGGDRSPVQMNCSGKHAGMLLTCVVNGWPTGSYLDESHPLQAAITAEVEHLAGEAPSHVGVDGCGAPAHVVSLVGLARAFASIARGADAATRAVHAAMSAVPEMVGGPRRDVTLMMQAVPGLMMKDGAEGVLAAALPDGRAIALKVADGANRARPAATVAALRALGVDLSHLDPSVWSQPILGHGQAVGDVRVIAPALL